MSAAWVAGSVRAQAMARRRLGAEARRQGVADADAEAVRVAARARDRRAARSEQLRVQRELYEQLRERSRAAVVALRDDPGYARLRTHLAQAVWRMLGGDAVVADADTGGVTGSADGRRLDLSLAQFADRAVDEIAWRLFDGSSSSGSGIDGDGPVGREAGVR